MADFRILGVLIDAEGRPRLEYESETGSYYLLRRGTRIDAITQAVAARLGAASPGILTDPGPILGEQGFYRVQQVSQQSPLDSDGDGMDDVFELFRADFLNALNAADAAQDFDGDGVSNRDEYAAGTDPAVAGTPELTTLTTSPVSGERTVSVNRETVVRFSQPLAEAAVVPVTQFKAEFGGRSFLSRVEVASDRRSATLFYLEPLPSGARIRVTFNAAGIRDQAGKEVDADGDGVPGGIALIDYETSSGTSVSGTAVIGRVFASELVNGSSVNRPLRGVTVTVDGREESLRAVTDDTGNFRLDPAPAGEFFVHVDGRTSPESNWPGGAYYPFVGKKWQAIAGKADNLAGGSGEIYLPRIEADALKPVSNTADTPVTFPAKVLQDNPGLAGVSLIVPANALFNENGARGGSVGIAPVAPDRLPEPLPPGLNFPLVITVQTDGPQNFDRPAPVRFPNLPDPVTGLKLAPGAKSALWSFNHDLGAWEIVGPMTVTADGNFVETDPGVGILQPGWHGTQQGTSGGGGGIFDEVVDFFTPDFCSGGPNCPPPIRVRLDVSPWTYTFDDDDAGGNYAAATDFAYASLVCFDTPSRAWRLRARRLFSYGNINLTLKGSIEPKPEVAGNVNATNYCEMIRVLKRYSSATAGVGGRGDYHVFAASKAHEDHHRDVDVPRFFNPHWSSARAVMEANSVPCYVPRTIADAILQRLADEAFAKAVAGFWADWKIFCQVHNSQTSDEAYQVGQRILDQMIQKIRDFATAQGFAACPEGAAAFANAFLAAADPTCGPEQIAALRRAGKRPGPIRTAAGDAVVLADLFGSANSSLVDAGATAQLTVTALYSDDTRLDVTSGASGTKYRVMNPSVVSVDANGKVTGLKPGIATVVALHSPGLDMHPLNATVRITVRDPADRDNDGMLNDWELQHGLNPDDATDAMGDLDRDGLKNEEEFQRGTNPTKADTDGDGTPDQAEVIKGQDPVSQQNARLTLQNGLHYYVLVDVDRNEVVQRGVAGSSGKAHDRLNLPPDRRFREFILQAGSLRLASANFVTPASGNRFELPAFTLNQDDGTDGDGDGLSDTAEFILGTDEDNPDSDGDGVLDGAEVQQGTDPVDGLAVRTGIINGADTPGNAVDIAAVNDVTVLALEDAGVAIFNVFNGLNPALIGQVDTPGTALRVALDGSLIAVADGAAGLAVIQARDPAAAQIVHQVNLGGAARSVAVAGGIAFAGTAGGDLVAVDLASGLVLSRLRLDGPVVDVVVSGDGVFALTENRLHELSFADGTLSDLGSASSPVFSTPNARLFVGDNLAYAVHGKGANVFDLASPGLPRLVTTANTTQFGWKQLVANGSGLALAAVSPNSTLDGPHHVSLYDLSDPMVTTAFVTEFVTPGISRAVTIYNGLAYVADGPAGLQVINYRAYDRNGVAPTITLTTSFASGVAEEGKPMRLSAQVRDDVQVRNVRFYVDGEQVNTDGNFPFETRVVTPLIGPAKTSFKVRALATDTGGNSTWSEELTLNLVPDATAPRVTRSVPYHGALIGATDNAALFFSEPLDAATVVPAAITLTGAGADGQFGGTDDSVLNATLATNPEVTAVFLALPGRLEPGLYRLAATAALRDRAGNAMATLFAAQFRVFSFVDLDGDGVPDELEPSLGLDPAKVDSNGNGVPDGLEDPDNDGLVTAWEILAETDPKNPDSNGNSIKDGDEDADGDALSNRQEALAGTLPKVADTDGDGWNDETEVTAGSDPLNPVSRPRLLLAGLPGVSAGLPQLPAGLAFGQFVGRPAVSAGLPHLPTGTVPGQFVGRPGVSLGLPQLAPGQSFIVGRPAFSVGLQVLTPDALAAAPFVSRPAVSVGVTGAGNDQTSKAPVVGRPAVTTQFEPQ